MRHGGGVRFAREFVRVPENNCCDRVATRAVSSHCKLKSLRDERCAQPLSHRIGQKRGRETGPSPPPPAKAWWGGIAITKKLAGTPRGHQDHLLRQRCDGRGFEPLPIEIIAKRKVTPALEPQKAGRTNLATHIVSGRASAPRILVNDPVVKTLVLLLVSFAAST
jgi:hypothetical protein